MSTTALAAVVAKLTGLTTAGKTAVGLVVAAGAVGAAGGLPAVVEPTPEEPTAVVETEQPADDATDGSSDVEATEPTSDEDAEGTAPGDDADGSEDTEKELPEAAEFGQSVAEDARDGGVDGQEIAERAHARNAERAAARDAQGAPEEEPVADDDTEETVPDDDTAADETVVEDAGSGRPAGAGRRP